MAQTDIAKPGTYTTITGPIVGTDSAPAEITTSTIRPYTLANMDVDSAMILNAINKKLQYEATLDDVFVDVGQDVVFTGQKVAIPDAVVMRLKTPEKGARTQIMPLLRPLAGPGRGGTDEPQQGYERGLVMKYMKVYYNEFSQALAGEEWGLNYNDLQMYNFYSELQPSLSKWFKEDLGKQYREALLETYAWPLEKTGTALTQNFNPNFFVANTALGSQPAYDSTVSGSNSFSDNLATAAAAADTGTNGVNANIDLDYLLALDYYAQNQKKILPVMIGGKKSYVVMLPSPQLAKLLTTNNGQLGAVWQAVSALSKEEQAFPGIVGRVKSLVIIEDQRYPTIEFNQYSDNCTITAEYVEPGNDDARNTTVYDSSSNMAWDIGFLLGQNAIVDWEVTSLHFESEKTEYGKVYGKGAFTERGVQLGLYNQDTAADDTALNMSSIALMFTATSIVEVA